MRRWLALFGILALAAIAAVAVAPRFWTRHYTQRFECVRPGMTQEQVERIMQGDYRPSILVSDMDLKPGEVLCWEWHPLKGDRPSLSPWIELRVYFDADNRVTRKTVDGEKR